MSTIKNSIYSKKNLTPLNRNENVFGSINRDNPDKADIAPYKMNSSVELGLSLIKIKDEQGKKINEEKEGNQDKTKNTKKINALMNKTKSKVRHKSINRNTYHFN